MFEQLKSIIDLLTATGNIGKAINLLIIICVIILCGLVAMFASGLFIGHYAWK